MAVKSHTSTQWAIAAAICTVFVVFAVLAIPYYTVTVANPFAGYPPGMPTVVESHSENGTEGPFQGTWTLALGILGGGVALVAAFLPSAREVRRLVFVVSAILFFGAAVFALTDVARSVPEAVSAGISARKGLGPWSALLASLLGVVASTCAAARVVADPAPPGGP
jgi:hypothetical protein